MERRRSRHQGLARGGWKRSVPARSERSVAYPGSLHFTGGREEAGLRSEWEIAERTDMVLIEWAASSPVAATLPAMWPAAS
jgi:hypothetical protein